MSGRGVWKATMSRTSTRTKKKQARRHRASCAEHRWLPNALFGSPAGRGRIDRPAIAISPEVRSRARKLACPEATIRPSVVTPWTK
eukprot:1745360-Rhodomonas_salina.1